MVDSLSRRREATHVLGDVNYINLAEEAKKIAAYLAVLSIAILAICRMIQRETSVASIAMHTLKLIVLPGALVLSRL
jgi:hypothetical protein